MGDTTRVVYADYNVITMIIQFNPASQLPIKLHGNIGSMKDILIFCFYNSKANLDGLNIIFVEIE